jgi:hypothetical protein
LSQLRITLIQPEQDNEASDPMSKSNSIEIGPLADNAELKAFTHIISQALFFPGADLEVWLKREGEVNVRVARCQGKVTGGLIAQPMGQWFGGKSVPMASIRAVGVARRGLRRFRHGGTRSRFGAVTSGVRS